MPSRDERIELGWELLEQGEVRGALEAADALLAQNRSDDEAAYLAASALLELGEKAEAQARLQRLLEAQPDNDPVRLTHAGLLYETFRLDEADAELARMGKATREEAPALWLEGLLLDARGRRAEADRAYARAAALDPERYDVPVVLPREEFDAAVSAAMEGLPPEFAGRLGEVPVLVEEYPTLPLVSSLEDPSPDLLGLFVGTPITGRSHADLPAIPAAIYLFKRCLEREAFSQEDLVEQIRVTLLHELGHYLGMDEDDLDEAGFA